MKTESFKGALLSTFVIASLIAPLLLISAEAMALCSAQVPFLAFETKSAGAVATSNLIAGTIRTMTTTSSSDGVVTVMNAKLPSARSAMCAVWDGKNAYIFGGCNENASFTQILKYDPITDTISTMTATLPTNVRVCISGVYDGQDAIYLFGGTTNFAGTYVGFNTIIKYKISTDTITVMSATLPEPRYATTAIWTGRYAYIFGGYSASYGYNYGYFDQILRYDPVTDTVTIMSARLPSAREFTAGNAVWDGTNAYIFGGRHGYIDPSKPDLCEIVKYDPSTDTTTLLSNGLQPEARWAIWNGTDVYLFGGENIYRYTLSDNKITSLQTKLPTYLYTVEGVWIGDGAYLFGGRIIIDPPSWTDEIVKFTPEVAPPAPVGGTAFPADKLALLAPYIILAALIAIATVSVAVYWRRYRT